MKICHATTAILASCVQLAGSGAFAQQSQKDEHDSHHPQDQGKPPATKPAPLKPSPARLAGAAALVRLDR